MATSDDYRLWLADLFARFGPVRIKSMFGGLGLYADDEFIGIIADEKIYLRVDDGNRADYEAEGLKPFTFSFKTGKIGTMSYWQIPDRLYDDPDELALWARKSLTAARAKTAAKKTPKPKLKPKRKNEG